MSMRTLLSALVLALPLLPVTPCTASYFCPLESVVIETTVGGMDVRHVQAEYNCCAWKDGACFGTWEVVVEGTSPERLETSYTPCVETSAPEPPASGTWGSVKALYRPR
ncbi:MAG: hypothetical protein FJY74_06925 [Candidatus Eisenbacteria bacterium]|nr:hypothetical protein [Candidatus Eisenbacteria bacterium]